MNNKILIGIIIVLVLLGGGYYLISSNPTQENTAETPNETATTTNTGVTATSTETSSSSTSTEKTYTLAEVAKHNNQTSCWAVVENAVYDLTTWISKHPGGPEKILSLCGKDGTQAFEKQHDGKERPEAALASFKIGTLAP